MKKSYIESAHDAEHGIKERNPMSWNHAQCYNCWRQEKKEQIPVRAMHHDPVQCCFCDRWTVEGIFVRKNPEEMRCKHA